MDSRDGSRMRQLNWPLLIHSLDDLENEKLMEMQSNAENCACVGQKALALVSTSEGRTVCDVYRVAKL